MRVIITNHEEKDNGVEGATQITEHATRADAEAYMISQGLRWYEDDEEWSYPGQSWIIGHITEEPRKSFFSRFFSR